MAVTVDHEPLAVEDLGLTTVGQVLAHVQKDNRLVVQVLIDGQQPQTHQLGTIRQTCLDGHSLYIETANPHTLAIDVLNEVACQIRESDPLKDEAAELLQKNQPSRAMEKLSGCLRIWQDAQEAIVKTLELLRLNPRTITADGVPLEQMLSEFAAKLRQIKLALEQRDFVLLADVLLYEMADTSSQWLSALSAVRQTVQSLG
ncbi:MAG TPA: hypothetical protein VHP11_03790 [Tepidisphaeraceae bacterium]|nr:hypothetical protein [Tepidisphaeraceae bacterium]